MLTESDDRMDVGSGGALAAPSKSRREWGVTASKLSSKNAIINMIKVVTIVSPYADAGVCAR